MKQKTVKSYDITITVDGRRKKQVKIHKKHKKELS